MTLRAAFLSPEPNSPVRNRDIPSSLDFFTLEMFNGFIPEMEMRCA